jgi:hypothetical protein
VFRDGRGFWPPLCDKPLNILGGRMVFARTEFMNGQ